LFYCELFKAGLELILTRNAYYMYRLTPESLTSKKPKDSQIKAIKYLLSLNGFSSEERIFLSKFFEESRKRLQVQYVYLLLEAWRFF